MRVLEQDRRHFSLRCVYHLKIGKGDPVADDRSSPEIVDNAMEAIRRAASRPREDGTDVRGYSTWGFALP
jgi:hypothetical protein